MKKIIASFMTMCMFLSCNGMALAADVDPFASLTLSRYVVAALSGDSRGEIIISFHLKLYQKINVFLCPHYISCTIPESRWKNTQTFFCAMGNRQAEIDKI